MQVLARREELQRQGESIDGEIAHARRRLAEVKQERAFYQRQAARGKIDEPEFDARMDETEDALRYWNGEITRLTELRDDSQKVRDSLQYAMESLATLQAELPEIDQPPEELDAMPEDVRRTILKRRRQVLRQLCDQVIVWSDGQVKLMGVLDGKGGPESDVAGPPAG